MTVPAPKLVLFDVNETLSDMPKLAETFVQLGVPVDAADVVVHSWFNSVLRDGFAATMTGEAVPFATIAEANARSVLQQFDIADPAAGATQIVEAFKALPGHDDVAEGARALAPVVRIGTLSNGAASVADGLLRSAGVRDLFDPLLSVEDAGVWKPAPDSYEYASRITRLAPAELMLVAVHPWDLHGAARIGMRTAWLNRDGATWPSWWPEPDVTVTRIADLAQALS